MATPISNSSSVYDPSLLLSEAGSCDPSIATCAPPPNPQPTPISIPDVHITGDAGTRELMRRLDCTTERNTAILSCTGAGAAGLAGVASSATVIGAVGGLAAAFTAAIACGRDLRNYLDCGE